jgi:hypothetical protein
MRPVVKNVLLASSDPVALDAIAAKMMGFDPMTIGFIRMAHEAGLGTGDPAEITVEGMDVSGVNWGFTKDEDTFVSWGQKQIYWGRLKPFEKVLLRTPIVPWSYAGSNLYHNWYWYRLFGKRRIRQMMGTEWGRLFESY